MYGTETAGAWKKITGLRPLQIFQVPNYQTKKLVRSWLIEYLLKFSFLEWIAFFSYKLTNTTKVQTKLKVKIWFQSNQFLGTNMATVGSRLWKYLLTFSWQPLKVQYISLNSLYIICFTVFLRMCIAWKTKQLTNINTNKEILTVSLQGSSTKQYTVLLSKYFYTVFRNSNVKSVPPNF